MTMTPPTDTDLISIITPAYNRADLLPQTIDSVLAQDYPHWEMIIVDDGSTDATRAVADEYAKKDRRIICLSKENSSPRKGRALWMGWEKICPSSWHDILPATSE